MTVELDHLYNANFVGKDGLLKNDTDPALQLIGVTCGVDSEYGDFASIAGPQSFENLDGCAFTGPIGTQHRENLAGSNFEIDALDRPDVAVAFGELVNANDRLHGRQSRRSRTGMAAFFGEPTVFADE
jgi:hypothetical protein